MTTTGYTVSRLYNVFDVLRLTPDADVPLLVRAPTRTTPLYLLAEIILDNLAFDDLVLDPTPEDADALAAVFLQRLSEPAPAVVTLSRTTLLAWFAGRHAKAAVRRT